MGLADSFSLEVQERTCARPGGGGDSKILYLFGTCALVEVLLGKMLKNPE